MERYEFPNHRAAFGLAAVAMMALTFGLLVGAPAAIESADHGTPAFATANATGEHRIEVAIDPSSIEVVAVRERTTAYQPVHQVVPKQRQKG